MTRIRWMGATALALLAAQAGVVDAAEWKGKGQLGLVFARGNTDTDNVNAKFDVSREEGKWKNALGGAALRASSDGLKTAQRWELGWQTNYAITSRSYWFGGLRYEDDRFSGFDYQASATTGAGYKFIDTDRTKLSGQAGIGYRQQKVELTGRKVNDTVFRGDVAFEHRFTDTTRLVDKLLVEAGSSNTFAQNDLALEVSMTSKLALAVGFQYRYNSDPPAGRRSSDTLSTVNLVYSL